MPAQNYSNHFRWFPLFHFVVMPLLLLNFLSHLVRLFMTPNWPLAFWTLLSITLILLALSARLMVLKVQDRLIRLEERLRYKELLPPELAARASDLSVQQMIALRFAGDDELPDLARRVCDNEFAKTKSIKQAVKNWRADYHRA
jgi:hypothetical protein